MFQGPYLCIQVLFLLFLQGWGEWCVVIRMPESSLRRNFSCWQCLHHIWCHSICRHLCPVIQLCSLLRTCLITHQCDSLNWYLVYLVRSYRSVSSKWTFYFPLLLIASCLSIKMYLNKSDDPSRTQLVMCWCLWEGVSHLWCLYIDWLRY